MEKIKLTFDADLINSLCLTSLNEFNDEIHYAAIGIALANSVPTVYFQDAKKLLIRRAYRIVGEAALNIAMSDALKINSSGFLLDIK